VSCVLPPIAGPAPPDDRKFVRLKRGDDWGHLYWAVEPRNEHGMAEFRRGISPPDGSAVTVRWPDGSVSETRIVLEPYTATVSDHGHEYPVSGHKIRLHQIVAGSQVLIPIEDVEVSAEDVHRWTVPGDAIRGAKAFDTPVRVGGRSARFSTAQRQSRENQPAGPVNPLPDPLLEDIVNGSPFRADGPSEFEIREEVDKRLAKVAGELRSLAGAVDRLTEVVNAKLVAKPSGKKAKPSATPSADAYLASLDYALRNYPEFAAKFKASQERWGKFAKTTKATPRAHRKRKGKPKK